MKNAIAKYLSFSFFLLLTFSASIAYSKNYLWVIEGDNNKVYVQGSIHLLKPEHYPLDKNITDAFNSSEILVLEADMAEMESPEIKQKLVSMSMLPSGKTLDKVVDQKTYKKIEDGFKKAGYSIGMFKGVKPWFSAMTLTLLKAASLGYLPQYGLDFHFYRLAKEKKMKIMGLEKAMDQLLMLNSMPNNFQIKMLLKTVEEVERMPSIISDLSTSWKKGDIALMEKVIFEDAEDFEDVNKIILYDRNHKWVNKIDGYLKDTKNYFIVVGAAHFIGENGLLKLLKDKGYKIKQM